MVDTRLERAALWILLMLLTLVPWALE